MLAIGDLAVGFGEPDIALGVQALGGLVVDDAVGFQHRAAVVDLHVADGGDAVIGVVVIDLARLHEHLLLPGLVALDGDLGSSAAARAAAGTAVAVRERRRGREQAAARQRGEDGEAARRRRGGAAGALVDERKPPPPSPVLLVQQRNKPRQAPGKHRQPSRCHRVHQLGLAQILSHFRQDVKQKAQCHAT